jgi:hypothetical protein
MTKREKFYSIRHLEVSEVFEELIVFVAASHDRRLLPDFRQLGFQAEIKKEPLPFREMAMTDRGLN